MTNVSALPIRGPESADAIISENVAVLLRRSGDLRQALAANLSIEPSSLSHKLNGRRPWTATEIDLIAKRYGVSHAALFTRLPGYGVGPEGLEPPTSTVISRELRPAGLAITTPPSGCACR